MAKASTRFVCSNCGYVSPTYLGRCPNCGEWNTFEEETVTKNDTKTANVTRVSFEGKKSRPTLIDDVDAHDAPRYKIESNELNRVLGGGVVPGSLVLIGGDPGIGKSTLLLQVSGQLSHYGKRVLYVTGEESADQVKMRSDRLGVKHLDNLYVFPETDMTAIREAIANVKPDVVIIDSVQTMQEGDVASAVGSVSQVRGVTADLMNIAKTNNITIFVVGHVTKGGAIAGPKTLEHMVDTVLYFEGDKHHAYRLLRAVKNRFGSTNELGIFEMVDTGLKEVANPSEIFLEERLHNATGSAIVVAMEGTRPILVEIQALITPSVFGNAQRTATGVDRNRVSLIMAVLEKRAGLMLQNQDAYLKAAGGVKLVEPAIDLAMAISIASSYEDISTDPKECYIGELGLTGEIRRVDRIEQRIREATKLGFSRVIVPKHNLDGLKMDFDIDVVGVTTIREALKVALKK
ncbi:DNA repair protein RadA [Fructilactobacillus sanfranciscensis]|uniref:DNA repair protein RadA n=2 Tax=Fructilactobacillus sanfranciscensis TaxID=1625 RepID=G2KV08_FRUST|nr:DNA repair protein RadA [Fructilactobacillus sanfranciscensis]AEN98897.1 DNA repair protein radA-like protein [Fructilactobacillus sanfranciscensis TMW 1.1304]MCG7194279.1 DNA repair protein RadA [Fructilactobacillus sanfranciscensis]MCG7195862.1 DNA repair protein RadA [Fructilactobacillus sanfranciscensis]MDN4462447.1 DNA repair protein RadA [Fructilactobacillus sanfranciscensis]MVF15433.1 DNA repair protein RadA [Fructilactobacillus sanfranciscensis]